MVSSLFSCLLASSLVPVGASEEGIMGWVLLVVVGSAGGEGVILRCMGVWVRGGGWVGG